MNRVTLLAAALAGLCHAIPAIAQSPVLYNPGFEIEGLNVSDADGWREFAPARRRTDTDGANPTALIRSGNASLELAPGGQFIGADTNEFNLDTLLYNDPAYGYGCGPAIVSMWYAIPTTPPIHYQPGGMKLEFRRDNESVYLPFENLDIRTTSDGASGTTNGEFVQNTYIIWPAQFDFIHLYNNMGDTYGTFPGSAPTSVSILPFRYVGNLSWMNETGTMFVDDITYEQDTDGSSGLDYKFWDDQEVALLAVPIQAGVAEPAIAIDFSGDSTVYNGQLGFGCQPSSSVFQAINIIDRVPSTNEYPQTWADIVANGYVRSTYQNADGTTGSFGTSVITAPSYRPLGQPLVLIPTMSGSDVDMTYNFPNYVDDGMGGMVPDGPPQRSTFTISGTGDYGSDATVTSMRGYPDPAIGATTTTVDFTWTANQNIDLETSAKAVGNDAFRLISLSSMFASRATGEYDGSYVEVQEAGGGTTQLILTDSTPRGAHLFGSPVLTSVGKTFTLYQDTDATFNPDSPTIEVTIDSLTGVTGDIGVQGYLDTSTDPNDDSLSVWLEWVGAPSTIPMGTTITGSFTVQALPPVAPPSSCIGDIDGDGSTTVFDFGIFATHFGQSVPPGTLGDLDGNGLVNVFDFGIFAVDFGCHS